ncbi:MAG: hypothetical protein ACFFHV_10425 [Promethearchaeota archaeon]
MQKISKISKGIKENKKIGAILSQEDSRQFQISDNDIAIITDKVIVRIREELEKAELSNNLSYNYLASLEPRRKVLERKEYSIGVRTFGIGLLGMCVAYWIYFFFIVHDFVPLTHTTYLTLILISLTCINKFESAVLNSFVSVSSIGFLLISLFLINASYDIYTWMGGPILHGAMASFQIYIVLNKKVYISKRYLLIGFLFYIIFLSNYDDYSRLIQITNMEKFYTVLSAAIQIFYIFILTTIFIYFYKKRSKALLP